MNRIYVIIFILFSAMIVFFRPWNLRQFDGSKAVISTKENLKILRAAITSYEKTFKCNPATLDDVYDYLENNNLKSDYIVERISTDSGCGTSWTNLNNKGGFFYDPESGLVIVNLTNSLRHYIPASVLSKDRLEQPSSW